MSLGTFDTYLRSEKGSALTQAELDADRLSVQQYLNAAAKAWGVDQSTTSGLNLGYVGGPGWNGSAWTSAAGSTLTLPAAQTSYVERTLAGVVSSNTTSFTTGKIPMAKVVTGASSVTSWEDHRANLLHLAALAGVLPVASGGTFLTSYALGDTIYASATDTLAKLAGNTSATMAVLTQTGNGATSAAPAWTSTTGTGNVVRATSPTLVTPVLGDASGTSMTLSSLTSGRVPYATTAGLLTDSANFTFNGSTLTLAAATGIDLALSSTAAGNSTATTGSLVSQGGSSWKNDVYVFNARLYCYRDAASNVSNCIANGAEVRNHISSSALYSSFGSYSVNRPSVESGITDSGNTNGFYVECLRNYDSTQTNDSGTLTNLSGAYLKYGHYNQTGGQTPLTTNAYGIRMEAFYKTGTITNLYSIYIGAATTGGTVTNKFGIVQVPTDTPNTFASITTVSNTTEATSTTAAAAVCSGGGAFAKKIKAGGAINPGNFTVATLPAAAVGDIAYATDGRKVGEGAAAGTGSLVVYSNGQWRRLSDETTIAA